MKTLIDGVKKFQSEVVASERDRYAALEKGQRPKAIFITCSDSRIEPNRLTQTRAGELFVLRNAGNIVPAWGSPASGEIATVEYAIAGLGIEDIIVCGHSCCGAMTALLAGDVEATMPGVGTWLEQAEPARRIVTENHADLGPEGRLNAAIQHNVLCQLDNIRTHPFVAAQLRAGKARLHGWVYDIATGEVLAYDERESAFLPLTSSSGS